MPKSTGPPIDVNAPLQYNNGNVEIVNTEPATPLLEKLPLDEVSINGRRYRIPEHVVILDFWSKVREGNISRTRFAE